MYTYKTEKFLWNLHILNTAKKYLTWAWWHTPILPAPRRQRQEDGEFKCSLSNTVRPSQNAQIGVEEMAQSVKCFMCKHDTQVQVLGTPEKCWVWYMPVLLPLGRWRQRTLELTSHLVLLNWWVPGPVKDLISKERVERKENSQHAPLASVCAHAHLIQRTSWLGNCDDF